MTTGIRLPDIWKTAPQSLDNKRVEQVVGFAGDGKLRDGSACSQEFREFLSLVPPDMLSLYAQECLNSKFESSGETLQDIVNEMGRRLGFTVINGRYRGVTNQAGHDGLWQTGGWAIIAETKTTDAYQINVDTIAGYRKKLIAEHDIQEDTSSILIIVGRQSTDALEAQVRGSKYAWNIRLISVVALSRLVTITVDVEDPKVHEQVRQVLIPREYTKVDDIIDLVFSTREDLTTSQTLESTITEFEGADDEPHPKFRPAAFHDACISRVQNHLGELLVKRTNSVFASANSSTVVVCAVSREHGRGPIPSYWFAFHGHQRDILSGAQNGFVAFGCGSPEDIILIPMKEFEPWLDRMNTRSSGAQFYWYVSIFRDNGQFTLHPRQGFPRIPVTAYRLTNS